MFAQKKVIDHTVYDDWKTLKNHMISNNGDFVSYEITPHRGDGFLYIYNVQSATLDSFPRAKGASFSGNSDYIAFTITPGFDTLRTCELEEFEKKDWPKDSLGVYILATGELTKYERVSGFQVNDESNWMTFMSYDNELTHPVKAKKKCRLFGRRRTEPPAKSKGHLLTIFDPVADNTREVKDVKSYQMSKYSKYVAYITHKKKKKDSVHLHVLSSGSWDLWEDDIKFSSLQKMAFNQQEDKLVFAASNDTNEIKTFGIYLIDLNLQVKTMIASEGDDFLPEGHSASVNYYPVFTRKGDQLYFGGALKPEQEPEDTLVPSEKVKLDLWHHADQRLQPEQLLDLQYDKKKTSLYLFDIASASAVRLSDDTLSVRRVTNKYAKYVLGTSNERYAHTYNWAIPYPEDHYKVSLETGERTLIREGNTFGGRLSPTGDYYTYFNSNENNHFAIHLPTNEETCITCDIDNVIWVDDVNGMPMDAYPHGIIGWMKGEDKVLVQSEHDVWAYDFSTKEVSSITQEIGSKEDLELRPRRWQYDSVYVSFDNMYITGFDRKTKGNHYFSVIDHGDHTDIQEMANYDARVSGIVQSEDKSQMILKKMTAVEYPDLHLAESFKATKRISNTNPQQEEYNWVDVELVSWTSYDSIELEGLLYKPENYDPNKEYPLMVYFYELYSDRLHQHYIPKPTASIIYATEYASAGYLVFMPDIRYKEGHPAQSAYDCIMSGTDKILELYPNVDSTRMALQGQSWGGYQTAQLVTMTTRYKAAMAGAPVTNMFSAYGGIRWGSGLNRQFQYEKTQSRIGYTIWEKPELYVENSPQFHLPNVETPLMIMHNDGDGAVPWYQGIELFTGLKRLGKTTWLLNYNDEEHNLMRNANRIDLSIRMRQFFDHYLQGKEAPEWLTDGIPATVKGKELRY